jgi:hypothetical protein
MAELKDSGTRRKFETGAVRDCASGKGRMDLLPMRTLIRLAQHFEDGAVKYGDDNWRKGIPLRCFADSALRHLCKHMIGQRDEPHLVAAIWNLACMYETQAMIEEGLLPGTLNNLPKPLENTTTQQFFGSCIGGPCATEPERVLRVNNSICKGCMIPKLGGNCSDSCPYDPKNEPVEPTEYTI